MKKALFIILIAAVAFTGASMAQDILGPHNLDGHGCATCHAPHSGSKGNGGTDAGTGVTYLWGRSFKANTYQTFGYDGTAGSTDQFTISNPVVFTESDPLFHTAACLSCHDNGITGGGGGQLMNGVTLETTADGFNPPTFLNDGTYSLTNDHPVNVEYACGTANHNWDCTVASGKVTWTLTDPFQANFNNVYGHPIRFYGDSTGLKLMVECSTCHNPHAMNRANVKMGSGAGATTVTAPSRFFIRGWYDAANPASNSATQFCRSCHQSKSNEAVKLNSTTTGPLY